MTASMAAFMALPATSATGTYPNDVSSWENVEECRIIYLGNDQLHGFETAVLASPMIDRLTGACIGVNVRTTRAT